MITYARGAGRRYTGRSRGNRDKSRPVGKR